MRWIASWRWYSWIANGLWCAAGLALVLALAGPIFESLSFLFSSGAAPTEFPAWPVFVATALVIVTLCWQHFLVPLLASSEVTFKDRRTPRMMLRNFWLSLWMPSIVAAILCVTNLVPVYAGRHTLEKWLSIQPWILIVAMTMPLWIIPPLFLMRPVQRRLRANANRQSRCFECGYNLTGVWSSNCPECGTPRMDVAAEINASKTVDPAS